MITSFKNIWDFLKIDFLLIFKNSLILGIAYLLFIPVIRGISNLDPIHSAGVFGQSLCLIGAILLIPIIRCEAETGIKEIVYTKSWSYQKSVCIRLLCGCLLVVIMISVFAFVMQSKNCIFPLWDYISSTILYAVFLGLLGLVLSQVGNNVIVGYLTALGYWSLCQLNILTEGNRAYMFPVINGVVETERKLFLMGVDISLLVAFLFITIKWSKRRI